MNNENLQILIDWINENKQFSKDVLLNEAVKNSYTTEEFNEAWDNIHKDEDTKNQKEEPTKKVKEEENNEDKDQDQKQESKELMEQEYELMVKEGKDQSQNTQNPNEYTNYNSNNEKQNEISTKEKEDTPMPKQEVEEKTYDNINTEPIEKLEEEKSVVENIEVKQETDVQDKPMEQVMPKDTNENENKIIENNQDYKYTEKPVEKTDIQTDPIQNDMFNETAETKIEDNTQTNSINDKPTLEPEDSFEQKEIEKKVETIKPNSTDNILKQSEALLNKDTNQTEVTPKENVIGIPTEEKEKKKPKVLLILLSIIIVLAIIAAAVYVVYTNMQKTIDKPVLPEPTTEEKPKEVTTEDTEITPTTPTIVEQPVEDTPPAKKEPVESFGFN